MKVSKKILQDAQYDQHLRIRLACTNDLTASDGRYHRSCLIKFERKSKHMQDMSDNSTDMILLWLCQELEQLAEKAKILDITDVWESVNYIRQLRAKLHNDNFRDATDRLCEIFQMDLPMSFLWHKDCRSNYMSKSKIERLRSAEMKKTKYKLMFDKIRGRKCVLEKQN